MNLNFNDRLDTLGIKYCLNEQEYDYSKLKFIIVGDNPGDTEYEMKRFFIGKSGQKLRKHFETNGLVENFDQECIIFNKTFIHTSKTADLNNIKSIIGIELFDEIQKSCAEKISEISNKYKLPILIFGKSNIGRNLLFDVFWKTINEATNKKESILVYDHPSYNHFFNKWDKHKKVLGIDSPLELLKEIGTINSLNINNRYK